MKLTEIKQKLNSVNSKIELRKLLSELKLQASNNRSNEDAIKLVEDFIVKAEKYADLESLVVLYGLLILQLEHDIKNLILVTEILDKMQNLSIKIDYKEGLAFSFSFSWYIERMKGNKKLARKHIEKSYFLLNQLKQPDSFIYHFIRYSYAIQDWLDNHNFHTAEIFEDCFDYFCRNNLYHSTTMALGILIIIYQQEQNKEKTMELTRKILSNRELLTKIPKEMQSIINYFIGVGHKLSFNLDEAKNYLQLSQKILEPIHKRSIYSGYYLTTLSHLTAVFALQGELETALKKMIEVEESIKKGYTTKNLDSFSRKQIEHDFNLTKFYISSRFQNFQIESLSDLVQIIIDNIGKQNSNAILFSEFLLNANLTEEQLRGIKNLNNPSTRRVEHIINFLIEKTINYGEIQVLNSISRLKGRPVEERMTFTEKAFADLLAAQEYYKINRFAEIYPLLKKYENHLHRIEVLEMRVFMEAFIQVGAFKNGDPLGPALQYISIKKCKLYGFSRLENKLSDYLTTQGTDIIRMMM